MTQHVCFLGSRKVATSTWIPVDPWGKERRREKRGSRRRGRFAACLPGRKVIPKDEDDSGTDFFTRASARPDASPQKTPNFGAKHNMSKWAAIDARSARLLISLIRVSRGSRVGIW